MLLAPAQPVHPVTLDPGVLLWLGTAVWALGAVLVRRGLTARSRVQKDLTDQRTQALTLLQADHLQVVLREVVVFVVNQLGGHIRTSDEDRLVGYLSRADLSPQRKRLVEVGADATDFDRLQDAIIDAAHRTAWSAGLFLLPWGYLIFWGSEKGVSLPVALTVAAWGLATACVGYCAGQAWMERTASARFAKLQRQYEGGIS